MFLCLLLGGGETESLAKATNEASEEAHPMHNPRARKQAPSMQLSRSLILTIVTAAPKGCALGSRR